MRQIINIIYYYMIKAIYNYEVYLKIQINDHYKNLYRIKDALI